MEMQTQDKPQGRHPLKKVANFRALPESGGGGFTDAQIFWPFFYQVKVPKDWYIFAEKS